MPSALRTSFVNTADGSLLRAVRETIATADELLICVAFMSEAGVGLLKKEFTAAKSRPRLLVTTAFGTTDATALQKAENLGIDTRIYNPSSGTFHPKLYLGRRGSTSRAFIGSANMTAGLAGNVEAGIAFEGDSRSEVIRSAWDWAEDLWRRNDVQVEWPTLKATRPAERFDEDLFPLIVKAVRRDPVFTTLPGGMKNLVMEVEPTGLLVKSSRPIPQTVPAWMFNVAWRHLRLHGVLTNQTLLNELRVMRSSNVRAVLARVRGVTADAHGTLQTVTSPR